VALQFAVGERGAVVLDRRPVGIALGADFEVVVDAGARHRKRLWHVRRPVRVVPVEEAHAANFLAALSFHFIPSPGFALGSACPSRISTGSAENGGGPLTQSTPLP